MKWTSFSAFRLTPSCKYVIVMATISHFLLILNVGQRDLHSPRPSVITWFIPLKVRLSACAVCHVVYEWSCDPTFCTRRVLSFIVYYSPTINLLRNRSSITQNYPTNTIAVITAWPGWCEVAVISDLLTDCFWVGIDDELLTRFFCCGFGRCGNLDAFCPPFR